MKPVCVVMLLAAGVGSSVQAQQLSGHVRLQRDDPLGNSSGVLAAANDLQAGTAAVPTSEAYLETELRACGHGLTGIVTLQQRNTTTNSGQAWVNELYAAHGAGAWQLSAGKKIVAWDVGYGFRPNDMVQQEERRTMVSRTEQGHPLLLAEYFNADTAWSVVWVNPTQSTGAVNVQEPALAARVYQRSGAADWYGFARMGAHTGKSVGAALAWVASDALELHGSLRWIASVDRQASNPDGLAINPPWQWSTQRDVTQWLVGGTWTHTSQLSLLAELWWDGHAPSDAQWDDWASHNGQLMTLATLGAPPTAVAGNLAWQAEIFNTSTNLRRGNIYWRLSWQNDAWQPALDILYTPADHGKILTGSLTWQGDRLQVQGGLRTHGGPNNAVVAQLPTRRLAYMALTWAF